MNKFHNVAFVFPGQGAQYPGMGKDFAQEYPVGRQIFEESDDLLRSHLSQLIFSGAESTLKQTKHCQLAIFVDSMAILRVLTEQFPQLKPAVCAGLSLGEYTALAASDRLSFADTLTLVRHRAEYMHDACEETEGGMAVIIGLDAHAVEALVTDVRMPDDLWTANFNCPGQVVISGTLKGLEAGAAAARELGAKRVIPLEVHGAFHSGLMQQAEERLAKHVNGTTFNTGSADLVMNVPGDYVRELDQVRTYLIKQVTSAVRWEQGIRAMIDNGVDLFIEIGPGKTLAGMNRRIGVTVPTVSIDKVEDLQTLETTLA